MRAYLRVTETAAVLHIPSTGNQVATEVQKPASGRAPGWYRARAYVLNGAWYHDCGRPVDPAREAKRLDKLAQQGAEREEARTSMPGVAGYQHMANMATAAADTQYLINRHFARLLATAA